MIAIIDYRAGNLKSVERALKHLGLACRITADAKEILAAERVIFPGVGAAGLAMETIRDHGLDDAIHAVIERGMPFMGICLGTQIILERSEEDGGTDCLGVIPGTVRRFPEMGLKIPHMGWNEVKLCKNSRLFAGMENQENRFYFVHSYEVECTNKEDILTTTVYGYELSQV